MRHELKCWPEHFRDVVHPNKNKRKMVEIRKEEDRSFAVGDVLFLREYKPIEQSYTGSWCEVVVSHCLRGEPWLSNGYVAMSIHVNDIFLAC